MRSKRSSLKGSQTLSRTSEPIRREPSDSTAAFQAASGHGSVYVPPGTYTLSGGFRWTGGHLFGEPSNPPQIHLKASSGLNGPFVACVNPRMSTQNSFFFCVHDLDFVIESDNGGCNDAFLWETAQGSSVRNVVIERLDGSGTCFHQSGRNDGGGGGGSISNLICNGGQNSLVIDQTSQIPYRGCTFNGHVHWNGYWIASFIDCVFNGGFSGGGGDYVEFINCTTGDGKPFSSSTNYHTELCGGSTQFSTGSVFFNGGSESGSSGKLDSVIPPAFPNVALPEPSSACITIAPSGGDDTDAINAALAASDEVYFQPGIFNVSSTINLGPGKSIWGDQSAAGWSGTKVQGNANPILNVTGNGTGKGVNIVRIDFSETGGGTVCRWNGDPSSAIFDTDFCSNGSGSSPFFDVQSGGFFYDQTDPAMGDSNSNNTWMQYSAQGPTYMVGINSEHFYGPTVIISNAGNLTDQVMGN